MEEIQFATSKKLELIDITKEVENIVSKSKIKEGICLVYAPHATAAIILNENESGLVQDLLKEIQSIGNNPPYMHDGIDNNARAHLRSAFLGSGKTIPIKNTKLLRGTWQQIFFVELDGPRSFRRVVVEII